eukprot:6152117-Amphidinium_carterae.1
MRLVRCCCYDSHDGAVGIQRHLATPPSRQEHRDAGSLCVLVLPVFTWKHFVQRVDSTWPHLHTLEITVALGPKP